jgi:hypothetical protein
MNPDPVCSHMSDPDPDQDPVQIGPDPQHWPKVEVLLKTEARVERILPPECRDVPGAGCQRTTWRNCCIGRSRAPPAHGR